MQLNVNQKKIQHNGFTLMEVLIVVLLLGIIAGFALPNYQKAIQKAHERDATMQLTLINAAENMYRASNSTYSTNTPRDHSGLNTDLGINIIPNDKTYAYTYTGPAPGTYTATATWNSGVFTIRVNQNPIDPQAAPPNRNPCCSGGTCRTIGSCI